MQLVIDIPKFAWIEDIKDFKSGVKEYDKGSAFDHAIREALLLGTPLPEQHGKLVDISKIDEDKIDSDNPVINLTIGGECIEAVSLEYLNDLPPIIEAEKEVEE